MPKREYKPTLKMILVREFNWLTGQRRRLYCSLTALDDDLASQARELVNEQMDRDRFRHEARLMAEQIGNPGGYWDAVLSRATTELAYYQRLALKKPSCKDLKSSI